MLPERIEVVIEPVNEPDSTIWRHGGVLLASGEKWCCVNGFARRFYSIETGISNCGEWRLKNNPVIPKNYQLLTQTSNYILSKIQELDKSNK